VQQIIYSSRLYAAGNVLYNKFDVSSSSPPDNPPRHPNLDYQCVVATTGQWKVARCTEQHLVVCQSVHNTLPGKRSYHDQVFTLPISIPTLACVSMRIGLVFRIIHKIFTFTIPWKCLWFWEVCQFC